jgi:hypothetical protein
VDLEAFELVLLRRPQDAPSYPEEDDPAVRAGRLAVEIMTWYCPPGTMSQPGRTISLP